VQRYTQNTIAGNSPRKNGKVGQDFGEFARLLKRNLYAEYMNVDAGVGIYGAAEKAFCTA
jgi:hypothetical protein